MNTISLKQAIKASLGLASIVALQSQAREVALGFALNSRLNL